MMQEVCEAMLFICKCALQHPRKVLLEETQTQRPTRHRPQYTNRCITDWKTIARRRYCASCQRPQCGNVKHHGHAVAQSPLSLHYFACAFLRCLYSRRSVFDSGRLPAFRIATQRLEYGFKKVADADSFLSWLQAQERGASASTRVWR